MTVTKLSLSSSVPVSTLNDGDLLLLDMEKGGTGQLISRLTNDEIDVAM